MSLSGQVVKFKYMKDRLASRYQDKLQPIGAVLLSLFGHLYRYVPCSQRLHDDPSTAFNPIAISRRIS
jgi:hypothetical protein